MPSGRKRFTRIENFYILETLGVGAFAKVRLAIHCKTHDRYACKILDKSFIRQREQSRHVQNEVDCLARLNHKNIVQLFDVINTAKRIYIIMELVSGGELFQAISKKRLSEPQVRFYFHQLVEGVHYCHRRGVFHRDLKLENVLLSTEGVLKITDFGLSQLWLEAADGMDSANSSALLSTQCGSPFYVAPEIVMKDKRYSGAKVDAWACGIILYVLSIGALPFRVQFHDIVSTGNNSFMFKIFLDGGLNYPECFSEDLKDLLNHLLQVEPDERYAMPAVKKHPWFNGPTDDPGRHRSEHPQSQIPPAVAASLGATSLERSTTSPPAGESANHGQKDELMETADSLNLGRRVDSFEGTAPAALLPMASLYSDAPELENKTNELEQNFIIQEEAHNVQPKSGVDSHDVHLPETTPEVESHHVHLPEPKAGVDSHDVHFPKPKSGEDSHNNRLSEPKPRVHGHDIHLDEPKAGVHAPKKTFVTNNVNGLQEVSGPSERETAANVTAVPNVLKLRQNYKEENMVVHNWNVVAKDFEVGEHVYLLSQETAEGAEETGTLLRAYSLDVRKRRPIALNTRFERARSEPKLKFTPSSNHNVHPFQNLSKESKMGTVRQQLWEHSINQWRSEHISEAEKMKKTDSKRAQEWEQYMNEWRSRQIPKVQGRNEHKKSCARDRPPSPTLVIEQEDDYHLVGDSVEFELPDRVLKSIWTHDAVFGLHQENKEVSSAAQPASEVYAQNGSEVSRFKKSYESIFDVGSPTPIPGSHASTETNNLIQRLKQPSSYFDMQIDDFRAYESMHNESSSTAQHSGKGGSRSPEIERLKLSEKESLSTRRQQRGSSGRDRQMPSSPRTPRSNKDSRRFTSGHSVDRALFDVSDGSAAEHGIARATNSAHQSKPESFSHRQSHEQDNALVLNPFKYELIPGPRVIFPSKNPFAFLFPEGRSYKSFFSKFKHQNKPRRQLQFRTLLEPTECRSILEDVLRDYGCSKVVTSKKSDNRFRIKCSITHGDNVNTATLRIFEVDKGLSGVHFESDSSDPAFLQGMYSAVATGFRARSSCNTVHSEREGNDA